MSRYRLHVDIALDPKLSLEDARTVSNAIVEDIKREILTRMIRDGVSYKASVRLQHDEDRTPHNYLDLNEQGHAAKAKTVIGENTAETLDATID